MCYISRKEFDSNMDYYLDKSRNEDVFVIEGDKVIFKLTSGDKTPLESFLEFCDELDKKPKYDLDKTDEEIIFEEIAKKCSL